MHNRHGQSGFHFLILDLKASKQEYSFIFPGTKAQTFGAKEEIVSVPYFTVLRSLLENPLCVLRLNGKDLLVLKTSPIIAGKAHEYVYIFLLAKSGYFCGALRKRRLYLGVPEMLIYNQNKHFLVLFRVHCCFYYLGVWSETSRKKGNN